MAGSRVKGITVEIGGDVSGLDKALSGVNKNIRDTQTELKDVEKLLKLDPKNVELLAQKQRLLAKSVDDTGDKLKTLREAEKQVQQQFERGDIGQEQYDRLKREIIQTESQLDKFAQEARQAEESVNGIDEDPVEDVKRAAGKAADALEDAGKEAASFGDVLKAGAIIEGVKGIASGLADLNEQTKEYRKIMGTLEVSSEQAGYSTEQTQDAFRKLYGVMGDDQTTATTLANLQAIGVSQTQLKRFIDGSVGAWAKYGDSIPIDGLSEAINETIKTGKVTGTFADVLNWAGESEDAFNESLEACGDEAARANLVLQQMNEQGLLEAGRAWRENNEDIVAANEAQADFTAKAAELSERVSPAINAVKEGGNGLLQLFLDLTEGVDMDATVEKIQGLFDVVANIINFVVENKEAAVGTLAAIGGGIAALKIAEVIQQVQGATSVVQGLTAVFPGLGTALSALTSPVFLVGAAVVGLVALIAAKGDETQAILESVDAWLQNVFATDWTTVFGPVLGDAINAFLAMIKNIWDPIRDVLNGIIDFIRGVFTGDWNRAWSGVVEIFRGLFGGLEAIAKIPLNAVIGLINGAVSGINWLIQGANKIPGVNIPEVGQIPYLANGGILSQGSAVVGEAGPELLTMSQGRAVVQPLTSNSSRTTNVGGVNVNVYGAPGQDVHELAMEIMQIAQQEYDTEEVAIGV